MRLLEDNIYLNDIKKALKLIKLDFLRGKTILITGGLGLICSCVVDMLHFANIGVTIYVADINESFFESRFGGFDDIKYIKYDALKPISFDFSVDYIIHGAGLASPELYVNKPVETMLSNFNGLLELLNFTKCRGAARLLYISSSEVYGNKISNDPFIENVFGACDINNIRSSYSESKRASEVLCRAYSAEYNVDTVIVRPGHIYGPTASPFDKRISSEFAFKAAKGEELFLKSSGLQIRSYCYCIDCASAILTVLLNGIQGESYNIGHNQKTSIKRMCQIMAAAGNVRLSMKEPSKEELNSFNPMMNSSLDNNKIKYIGYEDSFSVEEGITHTVSIIKNIYF